MLLIFCYGIYAILVDQDYHLGIMAIAVGGYAVYESSRKARNREPQIILSDRGIQLEGERHSSWEFVSRAEVYQRKTAKSTREYFRVIYYQVDREFEIQDLDISYEELQELVAMYVERYKKGRDRKV